MIDACDACLRRAHLIGHLATRIAGLLDRPRDRTSGLLALSDEELIAATGGGRDAEAFIAAFEAEPARRRMHAAAVGGVCGHAAHFPAALKNLTDPPAVLFLCGQAAALPALDRERPVTIVGTRHASPYGLEMARSLAAGLAAAGLPIVSGLALGVDGAAHEGCLSRDGFAVAVLAGGADVPYPQRHRSLYQRIRATGLVLSELPPGQHPFRWSFPARNRLMAALGAMTVVVEAARSSGSLITVAFAQDLDRPVGAVPGRATSRYAAGSNDLLATGAKLVAGAEDVLDELFGVGMRAAPAPERPPEALEPELRAVLAAVESDQEPAGITRATGLSPRQVRAALSALEGLGLVRRSGLGEYTRSARPP